MLQTVQAEKKCNSNQHTATPTTNFVGLKTPISFFHHDSAAIISNPSFFFVSVWVSGLFRLLHEKSSVFCVLNGKTLRGLSTESYSVGAFWITTPTVSLSGDCMKQYPTIAQLLTRFFAL